MNKFLLIFKKLFFVVIYFIVLILILSILFKIDFNNIFKFIISTIFITIGVSLYLTGYDMSYSKISDKISHVLLKRKSIFYVIIICLILGIVISLFEPELIKVSNNNIYLLFILALSISFFFCLSIYRIITKTNFKYYLIFSYAFVFLLIILSDYNIIPFVFDRASLATGLVSSPFLLTMGLAFSKRTKRPKKDSTSFGILGLCSLGPMFVFLIMNLFKNIYTYVIDLSTNYILIYNFISIIMIFIIYCLFLEFKFKKNKNDIIKVIKGLVMVLLGVTLFIIGSNGLIQIINLLSYKLINYNYYLTILVGGIIGYLIIKIEPSFNFLMNYVVDATNGGIKENFLEFFLSIGVSIAMVISIIIVKNNLNILYFLVPSFFIAIFLAFVVSNRFLAIAFDSLGAVIGIISSSFFLPFLLGINSNYNMLGILALIGIIPVIFLEIAGYIYEKEEKENNYNYLDEEIVDYD